jgi:hypothetical protein
LGLPAIATRRVATVGVKVSVAAAAEGCGRRR